MWCLCVWWGGGVRDPGPRSCDAECGYRPFVSRLCVPRLLYTPAHSLAHLRALTLQDNQFGMAVDSGSGPALARASPNTLASTAPAAAFQLRATVLAVQTDSVQDWLQDLAALVTVAEASPRPLHDAFWDSFWGRCV